MSVQVVAWTGDTGKVIVDDHSVKLQTFGFVDSSNYEVWKEKKRRGKYLKQNTKSHRT